MFDLSKALAESDLNTVKECLRASVEGDFFPDWEFETLFGVSRETVRTVYNEWPTGTVSEDDVGCAVVGALNNLLGYPHGKENDWAKYISVPPESVRDTLDRLIELGL
jgi:hypothetical protein